MTNEIPKGSVLGTILLIGGSCIGAGMLGLPIPSALTGFFPSTVMLLLSCLFMIATGLLLLETTLSLPGEVNLITAADKTLGRGAKTIIFLLFGFLFYSIMVAYSSGSGALFAEFTEQLTGLRPPDFVGGGLFNLIFGALVLVGTKAVDKANRLMMLGLIVSYLLLVSLGIGFIDPKKLEVMHLENALYALPILIISFGYHNLVPSLTHYLGKDTRRMVLAIIVGCLIPLFVYVLWNLIILGIIPEEYFREAAASGSMVTAAFREHTGNSSVATITEFFAFFAIVTSFIGVALSFVDFLKDALKQKSRFWMTVLALLPPYLFSIAYPRIFLTALDAAGGFGAVFLFGVVPALMAWSGRYRRKLWDLRLLPFGKLGLVIVILFSLLVFAVEFKMAFG